MDKVKLDITKLNKEKSQLLVLSLLVIVIMLVSYFYFFLKPKAAVLREILPEAAALDKEVMETGKLISNIDDFKKEISKLKKEVGQYETKLPTEKEITSILNQLSALASQEQVKIIGIRELGITRDDAEEKERAYKEVPIEIEMKSGYHQLGRFINKIESSDRLMKIESLEINSNYQNLTEHTVKLVISSFVLVKE